MSKRTEVSSPAVSDDWLAVSTDGFAAMNAGRPPEHLVKELVQNGLDALDQSGGEVALTAEPGDQPQTTLITCRDSGGGMNDLLEIRTVFWTSKTDSHLKRGRMGRGFKEMLCLADWASVSSGKQCIRFEKQAGKRMTRQTECVPIHGTLVQMQMPWGSEVIGPLVEYFTTFLPPPNVRFTANGQIVARREPAHIVEATLPTELFESGRWVRPPRKTTVELVSVSPGEEPLIYELGLPVCPVEWDQPYHANVLQRVPMNPGRDAVASGYLLRLHKSCLPVLLAQMNDEQVRSDWVGNAAPHCDENVQKEIIRRGFGENIARSVPKMGARQFDEDARDIGIDVVDTRQTSGGLRQILQEHVPTTREVVDQHNRQLIAAAASGSFDPSAVSRSQDQAEREHRRLVEAAGGKERVQRVMDFARWFCQKLLDGYGDVAICSVTVARLKAVNAVATWSANSVLTLGIDTPWLWSEPLGAESLSTLIHEAAHHLNAHHGRDFHKEVENLAGRAARLMFDAAEDIRKRYGGLLEPAK